MDINIVVWNCQGMGHLRFRNIMKGYRKDLSPNLFCFLEPRVSGARVDSFIARMRFRNSFKVEANGFGGGIWVC